MAPDRTLLHIPSADGVTLAVHELGPDDEGSPALLAHATGFHARVWRPLARHLSGLRSFAVDFRGHGDSPVPEGNDFGWEGFADDVLATVDGLGLGLGIGIGIGVDGYGPVGIGHSKGGAALLLAEARRPGTFRSLWIYEPVVLPPRADVAPGVDPENHLSAGARGRRSRFDSFAAAEANFASKPPMARFDPEVLHEYVQHGFTADGTGVHLKCRPADEARMYEMGGRHDAWDRLALVTCPVTVLRGRVTSPGPSRMAPDVADRLPKGRLEAHDDLDHFGPMEAPAAMAASILEACR